MSGHVDTKILERIQKLHAHAESAKQIGSLEEAASFAAAVQKMLAAHKLSLGDLTFEQKERTDPLGGKWVAWTTGTGAATRRKRVAWIERLAGATARAHYCQILIMPGSARIDVIGRQSDREVAEYMIVTLVELAQRLAQVGYWKARYQSQREGHYNTGHFKTSFLNGFVDRLEDRYRTLHLEQQRESSGMALVVSKSRAEVQKYVDEISGRHVKRPAGRATKNMDAYQQGRAAASQANLNGAALRAGTQGNTKQVGGGE